MSDITGIVVAVLIVLACVVFTLRRRAGGPSRVRQVNKILITGPVNSGKTKLFFKLVDNKLHETTTSFCPNSEVVDYEERKVTLVDTPGDLAFDNSVYDSITEDSTVCLVLSKANASSTSLTASKIYHLLASKSLQRFSNKITILYLKSDENDSPTSMLNSVEVDM